MLSFICFFALWVCFLFLNTGLLFGRGSSVMVDPGATILSAHLQFHADESQSEPTSLMVKAVKCARNGCASSLPQGPSTVDVTSTSFNHHTLTIANASWENVPPWTVQVRLEIDRYGCIVFGN